MHKKIPIQLAIPTPCNERWEDMRHTEHGRFCAHCQKQVIDFTNWTDAALDAFFRKNTAAVCGRLSSFQLNRDLIIPPQPHSRLYRIAVGLGLVLIFAQAPAYARKNPPLTEQFIYDKENDKTDEAHFTKITGKITDEKQQPVAGAIVIVFYSDSVRLATKTDSNGNFSLNLSRELFNKKWKIMAFHAEMVDKTLSKRKFLRTKDHIMQLRSGFMLGMVRYPFVDANNVDMDTEVRKEIIHYFDQ